MAMAIAVASTSFTSLKRTTVFGAGVQGLRAATHKGSAVKLGVVPCASAKLSTSTDGLAQQVTVGANAVAGAMFAAMASSESAMASQQMMALAEGDNRAVALLIPLVPAIGWVLFNILKPALNQVDRMRSVKGLVAGAGLGAAATLLAAPHADAAQEIANLADGDARGLIIIGLLLPAIGWVLFNILQPALNQFDRMRSSKGVIGALGLGGLSMLLAPHADAAQEIANLADGDARGLIIIGLLLPAIGWVLFNILQPALNQFDKMRSSKGVIGALGLGGLSMLLAPHADAAQEIATLADSDSRGLIILGLLLPAIGWVLFNILKPALNQFDRMVEGNSGKLKSRAMVGATGISAAAASLLLSAPQADAQVQEMAQLGADSDSRGLIILFILLPAIGWVLFNILQPGLNQFEKMQGGGKKR